MNEDRRGYRSTQSAGSGAVAVVLLALLGIVAASVLTPEEPLLLALGVTLAMALLLLHSVNIVVDEEALRVRLGIGWIRWHVLREEIVAVDTVRLAHRGTLPLSRHEGGWVVGFDAEDAVRITMTDSCLYVATREPIELALAVRRLRETA